MNKCDLEGAERVAEEIRLSLNFSADEPAPVVLCSAETGEGVLKILLTRLKMWLSAKWPSHRQSEGTPIGRTSGIDA